MKELIDKAVAEHGKKETIKWLKAFGLVKPDTSVNRGPCKVLTCPTGYYFNETLCACVFDVG